MWDFGYFAFDHCTDAVGYYKYAEFVIAMRGHGQIVPICFNTPVISMENHPKHRGLMEELDLLDYNVSLADDGFSDKLSKPLLFCLFNEIFWFYHYVTPAVFLTFCLKY